MVYNNSIKLGAAEGVEVGQGLGVNAKVEINLQPKRDDIAYLAVPANELAQGRVGNFLMAALIALGAFAAKTGVVEIGTLQKSLFDSIRPGRHQFVPVSQQALAVGAEYAGEGQLVNAGALRLF
jgi:Pyruvate/2-oxoacid:ferredoxin oxidoreductase gamma subunit